MAELPILPAHIEETVRAIARLRAAHHASATPLQRFVERLISRASRPAFVAVLTIVVAFWIVVNFGLIALGHKPLEEPPFFWLQGLVSLTALYMTVLILTTQRWEDELVSLREQLTLELAILSEQKSAKIISLLEELRRDDPQLHNRHDVEAEALSTPADPNAVLEAIKNTQATDSSEFNAADNHVPTVGLDSNSAINDGLNRSSQPRKP